MALLQISEPGQSPEPHERKRAVGIDLGTTNSLVATVKQQQPEILAGIDGSLLLPSVVHYGTDDTRTVGLEAKQNASKDPLNTLISIKRLMGRGIEDLSRLGNQLPYVFADGDSNVPFIKTAAGDKSPVEVSADILSVLAQRGRDSLGGDLDGAVITVPAYFDDAQRQATKDAAKLAGLNVLRLLNEPTAAAVAYGLDQQEDGVIAIYDLGGGTFDISILRLSAGVFEVLATGGDSALGGDDIDNAIAHWIMSQAQLNTDLTPAQQRELLSIACEAKEALTDSESVVVQYEQWQQSFNREQFNALVDPLIQRTIRACKRALRDAKITRESIDHVIMVGGSTRGLRIREQVADFFQRELLTSINPDQVVALGAALQADILVGNKSDSDMLLLDVIPLSLGLETMGGLVEKVIHRNTTIPVTKAQEFTTFKDGQTAMAIHVIQGERELVSDCRSLARFELRNIPAMVAGAAHIRVTFQVDADGLLSVSAEEASTSVASTITVKPSYGLDDNAIATMLKDSFEHANSDISSRALREQQVEAERLIEVLSAALAEDGERLLNTDAQAQLANAIADLRQAHNGADASAIAAQIESLNALSADFAALRMDASIKRALAGQAIDDLEQ